MQTKWKPEALFALGAIVVLTIIGILTDAFKY